MLRPIVFTVLSDLAGVAGLVSTPGASAAPYVSWAIALIVSSCPSHPIVATHPAVECTGSVFPRWDERHRSKELSGGLIGGLIAGVLEGGQGRACVLRARPGIVADAVQLSRRGGGPRTGSPGLVPLRLPACDC